jgi:hypothetical protein
VREEDLHFVSLSVDSSSAVRNNRPQSILAKRNGSAFYISPLFLLFSYFRLSFGIGTAPVRCFVVTRPVNQRQSPGREILT